MNKLTKQVLFISFIAMVITVMLLASCTSKPASAPAPSLTSTPAAKPASTMKPVKMRYSGSATPTQHISLEEKWFAAEVGKRTGGLVTVDAYVGGELYPQAQCPDAASAGAVEMGLTPIGQWSSRNVFFGFYNYFFMLNGIDHYERVKDKLTTIFAPLFEEQNVKLIHWFNWGDTGYAGNKPVVNPEDMKGIMIRGPNAETLSAIKALGGVPASIAESEVYDALAKNAVDGSITYFASMITRKYTEVCKYFTGPISTGPCVAFINLDVWKKLPPDIQKTIMDLGQETEVTSFKEGRVADKEALDTLKKVGTLTILNPQLNPQQVEAWVKYARPTYDVWLKKCQDAGYGKQAQDLLKVLDETR